MIAEYANLPGNGGILISSNNKQADYEIRCYNKDNVEHI